ncbi:MAG: hypothetical protein IJ520_01930 [Synergistaceae bacterium]|nr:hypothetical protein [Synergistaceae bacterium]
MGMFSAMSSAMKKQCNNENVLKKLEQLEAKGFDHVTAIVLENGNIIGDIDFMTEEEVRLDVVKDKDLINLAEKTLAVPENRLTYGELMDIFMKKCFAEEEKNEKRSKNLLNAALDGWEVSEEELYDLTDEDLLTLAKKTFGI